MELIYKNDYGAVFHVNNSPNPACEMQLVIDTVGLFMSRADLDHLLAIVIKSHEPCYCEECGGQCNKIWCANPLIDICLKVDEAILRQMEDLIRGTQFMLNMDSTLQQYRLKT
ncbi:MAG: hypothetical protein Mars2KO_33420 [Maribacter sp.]|uniref:hypothetical protein n=1 Tax=Maribacter sp. 2307UL18-2 TaxID=3386274 RepID=UPI0039BC48AA